MIANYTLESLDGSPTLVFAVDYAQGIVSGPDADEVRAWIKTIKRNRRIPLRIPGMSLQLDQNPLKSPEQVAAIFGEYWKLPPVLEAMYPKLEPGQPDAALIY